MIGATLYTFKHVCFTCFAFCVLGVAYGCLYFLACTCFAYCGAHLCTLFGHVPHVCPSFVAYVCVHCLYYKKTVWHQLKDHKESAKQHANNLQQNMHPEKQQHLQSQCATFCNISTIPLQNDDSCISHLWLANHHITIDDLSNDSECGASFAGCALSSQQGRPKVMITNRTGLGFRV